MDTFPLAILIAVPVIAAFVVFYLIPRIRRHEEREREKRRRRKTDRNP